MALTRTTVHSESKVPGGTGAFTTTSFTPPSSSLLCVALEVIEDGGGGTAPTGDLTIADSATLTWTRRVDEENAAATFATAMVIWTAPVSTGVSMTLTFDCGARNINNYAASVVAYTGYASAGPVPATGSAFANPNNATSPRTANLTLSGSPAATSEVFAAVGIDVGDGPVSAVTPGTGWTEIHDIEPGTGSFGGMQSQVRTGSTSASVDWVDVNPNANTVFNWVGVAVEVAADIVAPGIFITFTKVL